MHTLSSSSVFELVEPVAQLVWVLYPNGYLSMHLMYNCYWTNLTSCSICKGFFEGFEDVELKIYKSKSLRAFMYMRLATFKLWNQLFLSFKALINVFILKLVFFFQVYLQVFVISIVLWALLAILWLKNSFYSSFI